MALMLSPEAGLELVAAGDKTPKQSEADEIAYLFDITRDLDPETLSAALTAAYGSRIANGLTSLRRDWVDADREIDSDTDLRGLIGNVLAWNDPAEPKLEDGKQLKPEAIEEIAAAAAFLKDAL